MVIWAWITNLLFQLSASYSGAKWLFSAILFWHSRFSSKIKWKTEIVQLNLHRDSDRNLDNWLGLKVQFSMCDSEKDLGVLVDDQLSYKKQTGEKVSKANQNVGIFHWTFTVWDEEIFLLL